MRKHVGLVDVYLPGRPRACQRFQDLRGRGRVQGGQRRLLPRVSQRRGRRQVQLSHRIAARRGWQNVQRRGRVLHGQRRLLGRVRQFRRQLLVPMCQRRSPPAHRRQDLPGRERVRDGERGMLRQLHQRAWQLSLRVPCRLSIEERPKNLRRRERVRPRQRWLLPRMRERTRRLSLRLPARPRIKEQIEVPSRGSVRQRQRGMRADLHREEWDGCVRLQRRVPPRRERGSTEVQRYRRVRRLATRLRSVVREHRWIVPVLV